MYSYDRRTAAASQEMVPHINDALSEFQKVDRFVAEFPKVLASAKREAEGSSLNPGEVWQDQFVRYWHGWDTLRKTLSDVAWELDHGDEFLFRLVGHIRDAISMTHDRSKKMRVEYAIDKILRRPHPQKGSAHIAYEVDRLEAWHKALAEWSKTGQALAKKALSKAKRKR